MPLAMSANKGSIAATSPMRINVVSFTEVLPIDCVDDPASTRQSRSAGMPRMRRTSTSAAVPVTGIVLEFGQPPLVPEVAVDLLAPLAADVARKAAYRPPPRRR
jgi:hypothetical protein